MTTMSPSQAPIAVDRRRFHQAVLRTRTSKFRYRSEQVWCRSAEMYYKWFVQPSSERARIRLTINHQVWSLFAAGPFEKLRMISFGKRCSSGSRYASKTTNRTLCPELLRMSVLLNHLSSHWKRLFQVECTTSSYFIQSESMQASSRCRMTARSMPTMYCILLALIRSSISARVEVCTRFHAA